MDVQAVTGSGKTLAFVVPIIEMLQKLSTDSSTKRPKSSSGGGRVEAVIVSPTRELAAQTHRVVTQFTTQKRFARSLAPQLLVGGTDVTSDLRRMANEGCNIVIGTPGRLVDVLDRCESLASSPITWKTVEVLGACDRSLGLV